MMSAAFEPISTFGPVPAGWLWGVATAAHQIEGGNTNNDWWQFEHTLGSGSTESSGDACDSWHRWREDIAIVKSLGLDVYRFSLEWSRIEPAEGEFSHAALAHYRQILLACHDLGLKTCVTFHHFTLPLWVAADGSIDSPLFAARFGRFCEASVAALGDQIDMACTLNEPNIVALLGYVAGVWPPAKPGDMAQFRRVTDSFIAAHHAGVAALKAGPGDFPVGMTLALADNYFHPDGTWDGPSIPANEVEGDAMFAEFAALMAGDYFVAARGDDFIGVQTYSENHIGPDGHNLPIPEGVRMTNMTWTYSPEALGKTVRLAAAATGIPVIVTENGCPTDDDAERVEYISRALTALRSAMDDGVDVRGYIHWSLLDNFEWAEGYRPKFGLVGVDRATFVRTPKPSAAYYASVVAASRP